MAMLCAYCTATFGAFGGTMQVTVTTGGCRLQNPPDSRLLPETLIIHGLVAIRFFGQGADPSLLLGP
jgi:hypothetical protein